MQDVAGKVAFITGGANGIGLGIAKAFAKAGMKVAVADIREDSVNAAAAELTEIAGAENVHPMQLDVTDRIAMADAADEVERVFSKVHVLVNNAGVGVTGPVTEAKFDDWDWGMDVNLGGVINGIVVFLPRLMSHGEGGYIINTSSMAAVVPMRVASIYHAAKGAVLALSEEMRGELAEHGIGVSAFCPGPVQTNIALSGELRPEKYRGASGFQQYEQRLSERPNDPAWMDPDEAGERVLAGMQRDEIFIFTHREFKEGFQERADAMLASFPDEEINQERFEAIGWLARNPMYTDYLKSKKKGG